jgi:hypothetical protein
MERKHVWRVFSRHAMQILHEYAVHRKAASEKYPDTSGGSTLKVMAATGF